MGTPGDDSPLWGGGQQYQYSDSNKQQPVNQWPVDEPHCSYRPYLSTDTPHVEQEVAQPMETTTEMCDQYQPTADYSHPQPSNTPTEESETFPTTEVNRVSPDGGYISSESNENDYYNFMQQHQQHQHVYAVPTYHNMMPTTSNETKYEPSDVAVKQEVQEISVSYTQHVNYTVRNVNDTKPIVHENIQLRAPDSVYEPQQIMQSQLHMQTVEQQQMHLQFMQQQQSGMQQGGQSYAQYITPEQLQHIYQQQMQQQHLNQQPYRQMQHQQQMEQSKELQQLQQTQHLQHHEQMQQQQQYLEQQKQQHQHQQQQLKHQQQQQQFKHQQEQLQQQQTQQQQQQQLQEKQSQNKQQSQTDEQTPQSSSSSSIVVDDQVPSTSYAPQRAYRIVVQSPTRNDDSPLQVRIETHSPESYDPVASLENVNLSAQSPTSPGTRGLSTAALMDPYRRRAARPSVLERSQYKCDYCNEFFARQCGLTQHKKWIHSVRPLPCEKCGKKFATNGDLERHLAQHLMADKPHKCDICPKQFCHKNDLKRHRYRHDDCAPFVCHLCPKSFIRQDHLIAHLMSHERRQALMEARERHDMNLFGLQPASDEQTAATPQEPQQTGAGDDEGVPEDDDDIDDELLARCK